MGRGRKIHLVDGARGAVSAADYWTVYYGMNEKVRETFAAHGVEMTYDHLNVHMIKD